MVKQEFEPSSSLRSPWPLDSTVILQPKGRKGKVRKLVRVHKERGNPGNGRGNAVFKSRIQWARLKAASPVKTLISLHGCLIHPFSSLAVSFSVTFPAHLLCSQSPSSPFCPLQLWVCGPVLRPRTKTDLGKRRPNHPVHRQLPYHIILAPFPHQIPTTLPCHPCSAGSAHKAPQGLLYCARRPRADLRMTVLVQVLLLRDCMALTRSLPFRALASSWVIRRQCSVAPQWIIVRLSEIPTEYLVLCGAHVTAHSYCSCQHHSASAYNAE